MHPRSYIGLEFSDVYTALGSSVTFIEALDRIMPGFDTEIAKIAQRVLITPRAIDYRTGVLAAKVRPPTAPQSVVCFAAPAAQPSGSGSAPGSCCPCYGDAAAEAGGCAAIAQVTPGIAGHKPVLVELIDTKARTRRSPRLSYATLPHTRFCLPHPLDSRTPLTPTRP